MFIEGFSFTWLNVHNLLLKLIQEKRTILIMQEPI